MSEIVEFVEEVCGLYFRSILLPRAGMRVPQHTHDHDHATLVCAGAARLFIDDQPSGDYYAGHAVPVKAGKHHAFEALEPNTRLACIHDVASAMSIKKKGL
jgi:quercetin dioxygenase-like cupin family protein